MQVSIAISVAVSVTVAIIGAVNIFAKTAVLSDWSGWGRRRRWRYVARLLQWLQWLLRVTMTALDFQRVGVKLKAKVGSNGNGKRVKRLMDMPWGEAVCQCFWVIIVVGVSVAVLHYWEISLVILLWYYYEMQSGVGEAGEKPEKQATGWTWCHERGISGNKYRPQASILVAY